MSEDELHELEYLRYFFSACDFGPAHDDVVSMINEDYVHEKEQEVPEGYQ